MKSSIPILFIFLLQAFFFPLFAQKMEVIEIKLDTVATFYWGQVNSFGKRQGVVLFRTTFSV